MIYGIKHNSGQILAISKFPNDELPAGFIEITEIKYTKFLNDLSINPYCTYDDVNDDLIKDNTEYVNLVNSNSKLKLRRELQNLSIELDLKMRMGEDTTSTQSNFNAKKIEYESL